MKENDIIHCVRVGDKIEQDVIEEKDYCGHVKRGRIQWTVKEVYPHFVQAFCGLKETSFCYGELVQMGYETQPYWKQALMNEKKARRITHFGEILE